MNAVLKNRKYRSEFMQVRERNLRASEVLERALNGGIIIDDLIRDAGTGVDVTKSRSHLVVASIGDDHRGDMSDRF